MSAWAFLPDLLTDLELFEHPDHLRPQQQAYQQGGNGGPCGPPCDVIEYPQEREAVVALKKPQIIEHSRASLVTTAANAFLSIRTAFRPNIAGISILTPNYFE